ncbi:hypothetical protein EBR43_11650 [bacterium]|nr:hypothetical protein [bacterium]
MKQITITAEEKQEILMFAQKVMQDAANNPASRWKLRSNYSVQSICIGTAGEVAYGKLHGFKVNMLLKSRGDGGIDFKDGAQVKTVTYSGKGKKELKMSRLHSKKLPKKLVLAHYDADNKSDHVTLIGEISYDNFINKKKEKWYFNRKVYYVTEDQLDRYYI